MKRILLVLVVVLCAASVSAQSKFESSVKAIADQKWSVGLRVGSGLQADAECFYGEKTYVEGRFGMAWLGGITADFTALHNWNCCNWDWTPSTGDWFLDAGVGLNIGGAKRFVYGGVAGQVKFGIKFKEVPIRLSIDYTPVLGVEGWYMTGKEKKIVKQANDFLGDIESDAKIPTGGAGFFTNGLANFGISATYCF